MRSIWNGAIGFGLVNIPIKIYSASQSSKLDLDMLDSSDHSRIRFKRVNETTGDEVEWNNIVKAYKLEGEYVVLDDEDFAAVSPEKSKRFSIQQFVDISEIDCALFETPYFLEPQEHGEEAYQLLLSALLETGMAGVGTFILREKEILGLIRPYRKKILMINRMRFPEEMRSFKELNTANKKKPTDAELEMAIKLIKQSKKKFNPKNYENRYADELLKIIKAKAKGETRTAKQEEQPEKAAIDLMAQLKASLESNQTKKAS